jgi:hypothetical protein
MTSKTETSMARKISSILAMAALIGIALTLAN